MSANEKNVSVANLIADPAMLPSSEGTRPPAGDDNPALRVSFLKIIKKVPDLRGTEKQEKSPGSGAFNITAKPIG